MNTDSETNENEVTSTEVEAPETGAAVEPSDEEQVLAYLNAHESPLIKEKIKSEEGKQLCVSYILKNVQEENCTIDEAGGWLQQFLEGS